MKRHGGVFPLPISPKARLRREGGGSETARGAAVLLISAWFAVAPDVAHAGEGTAREALVTNQSGNSLSFVDLGTMKSSAEIRIGGNPAGIALSPDKKLVYVTAPDGKELTEVDTTSRAVKRRLAIDGGPLGIAVNPVSGEIYVAGWYSNKISVIDPGDLTVTTAIAVGLSPSGLAVSPDGKLLLSADRDSNEVSIIDVATRTRTGSVKTGERPFGVTIDADGRRAYTANVASDDVTVIDLAGRTAAGRVPVGHRPYAVALSAGKGFVTDQGAGTITVFDLEALQQLKTIEACDHPEGIETSAADGVVYFACWGDNVVMKIDAGRLEISGKATVGDGPRAFGKFLR